MRTNIIAFVAVCVVSAIAITVLAGRPREISPKEVKWNWGEAAYQLRGQIADEQLTEAVNFFLQNPPDTKPYTRTLEFYKSADILLRHYAEQAALDQADWYGKTKR